MAARARPPIATATVRRAARRRRASHRAAIRASLADLADVHADQVNVKGKTLEGLGAMAEGRAVLVHAVCLLERIETDHAD